MINCDIDNDWQTKAIDEIVYENKFTYFAFPSLIKSNPKYLYKDNSHLSELGNQYYGEYLFKNLIKNKNLYPLF